MGRQLLEAIPLAGPANPSNATLAPAAFGKSASTGLGCPVRFTASMISQGHA